MIKVFLDANVLFAAAYSQKGGSFEIINLAKENKVKVYTSRLAIKEAEKNLRDKSTDEAIDRFYNIFNELDINLIQIDSLNAKKKFGELTGEKDAPILAAALKSNSDFLITLDRKHLLNIHKKLGDLKIVTPGTFIEQYNESK